MPMIDLDRECSGIMGRKKTLLWYCYFLWTEKMGNFYTLFREAHTSIIYDIRVLPPPPPALIPPLAKAYVSLFLFQKKDINK